MINAKIFDEFIEPFNQYLDTGKKYARDLNITITGLCRDVESRLSSNLQHIDNLSSNFKQCNFFIYENDSKDKTPDILANWSNLSNKRYLSEKLSANHPVGPAHKDKSRTEALAEYRNKCKDYIIEYFPDTDYIFVVDLDFKIFSIDGIFNSLGYLSEEKISAMCGNAFVLYNKQFINYDSWAYRYNWWSDCQEALYWFNYWQPLVGSNPIKVNSAFGGICIYNSKYYFDTSCKYEGYDCEHVCFHKNLYNKFPEFNLSLNPSQIMIM